MNPYEVLGVKETASEAEIRKAYLELVRKYHPDQFQDNPLKELATEKLKEVNEAYDLIKEGKAGVSASSAGHYNQSQQRGAGQTYSSRGGENAGQFSAVREALSRNDIGRAEGLLQAIGNRSAEWHYLMGVIRLRQGQANRALQELELAVRMDPNNFEYRRAYESLRANASPYSRGGSDVSSTICQLCTCLSCANLCCPCCSGRGQC